MIYAEKNRKRVLIVNAYFDDMRRTTGNPYRVPRAMGPPFLAGALSPERCEVRLYNEQHSGMLCDRSLLAWPDMLVMTGVTNGFDRMLHLTAYARTLNPNVVVVAGGPAVRALPRLAGQYFDYISLGGVEDLGRIVAEVFGEEYAAEEVFPRFDLIRKPGIIGYVESSRYCNFHCNFCSLTAEGNSYDKCDVDFLRRQILAVDRRHIVMIDNNFYGNDRQFFLDRVAVLRELYESKQIKGWTALVTGDFFSKPENLTLVKEAGCFALFSGVESFDAETLRTHRKAQNMVVPQVEMIRNCLEAGIFFQYGIILDVTQRPISELNDEIRFITSTPEISLPAYFTLAIPLLGTPHFYDCMERGLLLPDVPLSEVDGNTITLHPLDPMEDAARFARDLERLRGHRHRVLLHLMRFLARYHRRLSPLHMLSAVVNVGLTCAPTIATSPRYLLHRHPERTYIASTEPVRPHYTPFFPVDSRYEHYFRPTMLTDAHGRLSEKLAEDLLAAAPPAHMPLPSQPIGVPVR